MKYKTYELKSCPFCGNDNNINVRFELTGNYSIVCGECCCRTMSNPTIDKAINCWNRRVNDPKMPTEEDIEIMKAMKLLYGKRYFGMDKSGDCHGFYFKPIKQGGNWIVPNTMLPDRAFCGQESRLSHISWSDNEPYYFEG